MKLNVGTFDRVLRAVLGVLLIVLALSDAIGAWGYIGIVPLATAVGGICPAYLLFGIDTGAAPRPRRR